MKHGTSLMTRCLALLVALLLVVSATDLGLALNVAAGENDTLTVSEGTIVAANYDLSAAEEELLNSGALAGDNQVYGVPTDEVISVDGDNKVVTFTEYKDSVSGKTWTPVSAKLVYEGGEESIPVDGSKSYTYAGTAFTVEAVYAVKTTIDAVRQNELLSAAKYLKDGTDELAAIAEVNDNLDIYHEANAHLIKLADGSMGQMLGFQTKEAKESALALNRQIEANGALDLYPLAKGITAPYSKYINEKDVVVLSEVALATYYNIENVLNDFFFQMIRDEDHWLAASFKETDESMYNAVVKIFLPAMDEWMEGMEAVVNGDWPNGENRALLNADADFAAVDALVAKMGDLKEVAADSRELTINTKVQKLMDMQTVTVKVALNVVGADNKLNKVDEKAAVPFSVPKGTAKADVLNKIGAINFENETIATWVAELGLFADIPEFNTYYVADYTVLPETLTEDVDYVITYDPVQFDVTGVDTLAGKYYYGETIELPKHPQSPDVVYDYTVNGEYMAEGEKFVVTCKTELVCKEGSKRVNTTLLENALKDETLTADEKAVLTSAAVNAGADVVSIRYPAESDVELITAESKVVAATVKSDYPEAPEMSWTPKTLTITLSDGSTEVVAFNGNEATFAAGMEYDSVAVNYELVLKGVDVGAVKNLPYALLIDVQDAQNKMNQLVGDMGDLADVTRAIMNSLIDFAKGETKVKLQAVLNTGYNDFQDAKLDLYHHLVAYNAKNSAAEKLVYFYTNRDAMSAELKTLVEALKVIKTDTEFKKTCVDELGDTAAKALDKIAAVEDKLDKIVFPENNPAIKLESAALLSLAETLVNESAVINEYASADLVVTHEVAKAAPNRVIITVNLTQGANKASFNIAAWEGMNVSEPIFNEKFEKAYAQVMDAAVEDHYVISDAALLETIKTKTFTAPETFELVWTAKEYPVVVDGVDYGVVTIESKNITLPIHPKFGMKNVYTINGDRDEPYEQGSLVNVWESLHNGTLTIVRDEINEKANRIKDFKNAMEKVSDKSGSTMNIIFEGIDDNGEEIPDVERTLTLELDIDADQAAITEALAAFAAELSGQSYDIYLNDEVFYYMDGSISMQALISAMLADSNFNNIHFADALRNSKPIITANMALVSPKAQQPAARALTVQDDITLKFELKKFGSAERLDQAARVIEALEPYVSFQSNNGVLDVDVTLPEKVYEAYLTALLGLQQINLSDVNAVNTSIATMFVYDFIENILGDEEITVETWQNTLEIFDETAFDKIPNYDLTQYEKRYEQIRNVFTNWATVTTTDGADSYPEIALDIPAQTAIDGLLKVADKEVPSVALNRIVEYKNGENFTADVKVVLTNTSVDFEAIVADEEALKDGVKDLIDEAKDVKNSDASKEAAKEAAKETLKAWAKGEGLANGIDYTTDLSKRLAETEGAAVVLLLDDINDDLVFNGITVLDLHGKTVNGNITSNSHLYIFDSVLDNDQGYVTGSINGNVSITAGKYDANVSGFLPEGYKQVNGIVMNELYTIEADGEDLTFVINSDAIDADIDSYLNFAKAVAAEIALDVAMNSYPYAMLAANGHEIYGFHFDDYVGLLAGPHTAATAVDLALECFSAKEMSHFVNDILADLLAFGDIKNALLSDGKLATYNMQTAKWTAVIKRNPDYNCMTGGLVAGERINRNITLQLAGDNKTELASLFGFLDSIVNEARVEFVDVEDITFEDKHFNIAGGIEIVLNADLSEYNHYVAVVLASGLEDNTAMVEALKNKDELALKDEFDKVTVKDLAEAMKVLNRHDSFKDLAADLGVADQFADLTVKQEYLETAIMWTLSAAGRALEIAEKAADEITADRVENAIDGVGSKVDATLDKLEGHNTKLDSVLDKLDGAGTKVDNVLDKLDGVGTKVEGAVDKVESAVSAAGKKTLGGLDEDDDGVYGFYKAYERFADIEKRGYGVNFDLKTSYVDVDVKLFDFCMWGDANHDNLVNAKDATLVLQYSVDTLAEGQFFCTKRTDVNADGAINAKDATLILQYSVGTLEKFPAEK